ncbi:hypothetical protein EDD22DRAFT_911831 [Suillus occidentalis]|nr:hypothetical protein EDD22DRAFT_911831 [Suillus occidentalis]
MSVLCPPTSYLPPIAKIASFSVTQLLDALTYLQSLYHPEVCGSRHKPIRSDAFEHSYSIRWLTALMIARLEVWEDLLHSGEVSLDLGTPETIFAHTEMIVQQAASLLAICAGRRVEAQLTDIPLDNDDYGSVGAQTWGGACVLAEMVMDDPERFGLDSPPDGPESRRLSVLELGAGTGLVSIVVTKLLDTLPSFNHRQVSVVATDFHPSVLANLSVQHAAWIKDCLKGLVRHPSDSAVSPAAFHLVIPLRPTHAFESSTVESLLLNACDVDPNDDVDLVVLSMESITCDTHIVSV